MRGPRTQAERDAQTVEIGFALLTGLVMAGLCFLLFAGVMGALAGLGLLTPSAGHAWLMLAGSTSATVFVCRVLYVLMRAPSGRLGPEADDEDGTGLPEHTGAHCAGRADGTGDGKGRGRGGENA
ncbi:DUF6332 family protein [Streptomyces sp. WMMB 322]|uniref:DUF6332 family protein n=1 Tax=Streptomyces sp. WMMB 322 TaxID=1286821 RepID=UPI0006E3CC1A|nr:DUF6332 family protein [Streptomyces sp. WMMB 322]SCK57566.1 hypothetical protein H180DRAFT_05418 [Streptomyces sp. WMMB 322]